MTQLMKQEVHRDIKELNGHWILRQVVLLLLQMQKKKCCNFSSTPLSLNAELIPPVYSCPPSLASRRCMSSSSQNKLHVSHWCRPSNWDTGSFIRTQGVPFSPCKIDWQNVSPSLSLSLLSPVTAPFIPLTSNRVSLEARD